MPKSHKRETFNLTTLLMLTGIVVVAGFFTISMLETQALASTNADIEILNDELKNIEGGPVLTISVRNNGTVDIASMEVEIPGIGVYEKWMLRAAELRGEYSPNTGYTYKGDLAEMNNKIYFAVRRQLPGSVNQNLFLFKYDSRTNSWTEGAVLEPSLTEDVDYFHSVTPDLASFDNKLYVSLKGNGDNLFAYDSTTNSWNPATHYPKNPKNSSYFLPGYGSILVRCDGKLYYSKGEDSKLWFKYKPENNKWIQLENFPGKYGTYECPTTALNGKIYVGGQYTDPENFYVYDTSTGSWSQIANCPGSGLNDTGATAFDNKVYVGPDENNNWWMYDPATDEWTEKLSYTGSESSGGGSRVASAGGSAYVTYQVSKEFQEYTPVASLPGVKPGENVSKNIDIGGYGFVTGGSYTVWITGYDSDRNPIVEKKITVKME